MGRFTLEDALELMPEVKRVTSAAVERVQSLVAEAQALEEGDVRREEIGDGIQAVVEEWAQGIVALGAEVKGLWLVDFDNGEGYYCWKHPEENLEHFHTYDEGFSGRRLIAPTTLH